MMKTIRSFFAIMLDPAIKNDMSTCLSALKHAVPDSNLRWVKIEHLHVTLQFLNSLKSECVPQLIKKMQNTLKNTPSFQLEIGALQWFPTSSHPKILSFTVGPHSILNDLSASIGHELTALNIPIENRPFRAHMTLGRLASHHLLAETVDLSQIKLPPIPSITINELFFIESKPQSEGSNYSPLARFKLREE
ncbi:RNA 2',3'-cyclic phosphodiesterase [Legionella bononiensis]|uniref:RNA 2',3'-cyclic phosphodiesterase n=1 Tax=Legionella bononiensis TaxID=2793102 RepID=A0ABS1WC01_9GAMM|nr:RNA 2',3'-cyclic phosphodiesterase [Legionella bononiensis]MBL7481176.1 RNA 2',3'-cyclic phosphodiesterase [Legionella bononiensis]MBL7526885.1 RNA 2',3'-cyclic phosphodiesterase [Legionella bononiensis]MBL7563799.1 RNA 2',3'-cyclic phosphodiesterase [Legionella bononiensis]